MLISPRLVKKYERELNKLEKALLPNGKQKDSTFNCPDSFAEFAPHLEIRSGLHYIPFIPYEYQLRIEQAIAAHPLTLIVKSRQTGVSETTLAILIKHCITNPAFLATYFSKGQEDTSEMARRANSMVAPLFTKGLKLGSNNVLEFNVAGGGRTLFRNSKPESGRSLPSVSHTVFDEAAFVPKIKEIFESAAPAQSLVGDAARNIIISSPNGPGTWFYEQMIADNPLDILELIEDVRQGKQDPYQEVIDKNGNCKIIIHWRAHPLYGSDPDYLHKVQAKTKMDMTKVKQEYDLDHSQSEELIFAGIVRPNIIPELPDPSLCDYFFMGVDVATTGDDYTVAIVLGLYQNALWIVDRYRARKQTSDYDITKIAELLVKYEPENTVVETNHAGSTYLNDLCSDYPEYQLNGIYTTTNTKEAYISGTKLHLERQKVKFLTTNPTRDELFVFRRFANNTLGAPTGKHDDCVIALSLAIHASRQELGDNLIKPKFER